MKRDIVTCDACNKEQHYLCGMQTWCECPCDGTPEWGLYSTDEYAAAVDDDDD